MSSAAAGAVLILVATDVDATCAAKALAKLLTEDEIMYRLVPVDGFRTLQRVLQEDVVGNDDVSVLLKTCRKRCCHFTDEPGLNSVKPVFTW